MTVGIPTSTPDELLYPSSDGQPMAETDLHGEAMVAATQALKRHFAARADIAVGMNMLFYYEKGNTAARFAPDVYVAIGAPKRKRRVYKLWEEPVPPSFVLEVSSRGTWLEDHGNKKSLCAKLGIADYFLFDPEAEYLDPVLQGYRLVGRDYVRVQPDSDGCLEVRTLGLRVRAEGALVRFLDSNGDALLQTEEIEARLSEAELRARNAEAELERLRQELALAKK